MTDLHRLTVHEAAALLRRGKFTPAELDRAQREVVMAANDDLLAYRWLAGPEEERPAQGTPPALRESPLWGIGGAWKANIASREQPTDCGSRLLASYRPPYDATVVARLKARGSHCLGKTNMDEFGMGSSTEHSAWGPTRNPWNRERTPGGSSGGAAAAVAADLAFYALGTDTGGSVRQPAHCCGVVGLKPTYGRVSRYGLVAFASSLDQIGPLTKDVTDAALVYAAIAGPDPRDATTLAQSPGDPLGALAQPVRGLKIGVPWHVLEEGLAPDVAADFQATVDALAGEGIEIVTVTLPTLSWAVAIYYVICTAEASSNLARFDGSGYGQRVEAATYEEMVGQTRTQGFGEEVKRRILLGSFVLSAGYYESYYGQAQRARSLLQEDFRGAFAMCDIVALPTAPTPAFRLGEKLADPLQMYLSDVFTVPANLTGWPALTVPTGISADHLPLSIQLMAPALAEERLFQVGAAVERARDFQSQKEALWRSRR